MPLSGDNAILWPTALVRCIRAVRDACGWCSETHILGIPLDWPVRLALLAGLYVLLRFRLSARWTTAITLTILLGKELFDILVHQDLRPRAPDWGDAADILSGLAGIGLGILIARGLRRQRQPSAPPPH